MSSKFSDEAAGPFGAGSAEGPFGRGDYGDQGGDPYGEAHGEQREYDHRPHGGGEGPTDDEASSSGLELVGGALFLAGCLPAAAVAKAIFAGTNLAAEGLGGTAALAAGVASWVGPWPALIAATAIAVIGALMVLGTIRAEPLRFVGGAMVSGLGLAAVMSAVTTAPEVGFLGAGGRLGGGLEGRLGSWFGSSIAPYATLILGLAVVGTALWLAFGQEPIDEDDGLGPILEKGEVARAGAGRSIGGALAGAGAAAVGAGGAIVAAGSSMLKRRERDQGEIIGKRADRQRRVAAKKTRKPGKPKTLGDAFALGANEGVSHDEANALAPDEKTLAYMEDVWRRAGTNVDQPEPIPPSPYPEDVRLKGEIPDGAVPLAPRPKEASAEDAAEDAAEVAPSPSPAPAARPAHPLSPGPVSSPPPAPLPADPFTANPAAQFDVAPFDFEDELSAPKPLNQAPPPAKAAKPAAAHPLAPSGPAPPPVSASNPFAAPRPDAGLTNAETKAYEDAVRREGASAEGPSELPPGVTPFTPKPEGASEEAPAAPQADAGGTELRASATGSKVLFERQRQEPPTDEVAKQAMQAGAMPASVSPPPRPAWEVGYDDDDAEAELEPVVIPDVDDSGRWQRRDDEESLGFDENEVSLGGEAGEEPSLAVLDELLAKVEASAAGLETREAELSSPAEPELTATPEPQEAAELAVEEEPPVVIEAEIEAEEEPAAEAAEEVELDDEIEEELAEAEEADGEEEDEDEDEDEEAEYEEYEESDELEDEEAEEGDEEVEYEYVDEDGNPIDPADLGDEYEFVDEDEDEEAAELEEDEEEAEDEDEDEEAEYEEYEEDDDSEAAEYEEVEDEPEGESEEAEDEAEPASAELDEPAAEDSDDEYEVVDEEESVVLEPQAPPAAAAPVEPEVPSPAAADAASEPDSTVAAAAAGLSEDAARIHEAGRIVVKKDRAAVSVIQKGFGVDFAEACTILEELHVEGLIGPYQEGKKRAILLSLEEWDGRFAHS